MPASGARSGAILKPKTEIQAFLLLFLLLLFCLLWASSVALIDQWYPSAPKETEDAHIISPGAYGTAEGG